MIISSVIEPEVATKKPRLQKWRPQNDLLSFGFSWRIFRAVFPFRYCTIFDTEICGGIDIKGWICGNMSPYYLYLVGVTDFSDQITHSGSYFAYEYRLTILCGPDEVVFAIEYGMGGLAIELHASTLAS